MLSIMTGLGGRAGGEDKAGEEPCGAPLARHLFLCFHLWVSHKFTFEIKIHFRSGILKWGARR